MLIDDFFSYYHTLFQHPNTHTPIYIYIYKHVCVRACVCARAYVCVCVCVWISVSFIILHINNPSLINAKAILEEGQYWCCLICSSRNKRVQIFPKVIHQKLNAIARQEVIYLFTAMTESNMLNINTRGLFHIYIYIYIYIDVCVCVCVCVAKGSPI